MSDKGIKILLVLLAGLLARLALGLWVFGFNGTHYDSSDYLLAADMLLQGTLHSSRLLTYPVLLIILNQFTSIIPIETSLLLVQSVFGLGSSVLVFLILDRTVKDPLWVLPPSILFAADPYIINWEHCMLTECLALFLALMSLYALMRVLDGARVRWVHVLMITGLLGIFLKLYFLWAAILLFAGLLLWRRRFTKNTIRFIAGYTLVFLLAISIFSGLNRYQNGITGLSETTRVLQLQKAYDYSLYSVLPTNDISMRMSEAKAGGEDFWTVFQALLTDYSRYELYAFNNQLKREDPHNYAAGFIKGTQRNTVQALEHPVATFYAINRNEIRSLEPLRLPVMFFLLPVLAVLMISFIRGMRTKSLAGRANINYAALCVILAFVLMAAGSSVEFSRFFYPVMGYVLIVFVAVFYDLTVWLRSRMAHPKKLPE